MIRHRVLPFLLVYLALLFAVTPAHNVKAQTYAVQYVIQIRADGSAAWSIIQATALNGTIDTWEGYQRRVLTLVDTARSLTQREMSVDEDSFETSTKNYLDSQSKITNYEFIWRNFSSLQTDEIAFGDVFQASDFFNRLYGDGSLKITYPLTFAVETVTPTPSQRDDAEHSFEWLGTQFFLTGRPAIKLTVYTATPSQDQNSSGNSGQLAIIGLSSAIGIAVVVAGLVALRRIKKKACIII